MKQLEGTGLKEYLTYYLYIKARVFAEFFLFTLPNYSRIRKMKTLENTKKSKSAFVFANGPSLNKLDPKKIKSYQDQGFDIFAGNSYINSEFASIVNPDYYIFSDPVHFGIYKTEIAQKRQKESEWDFNEITQLGIPLFVPHRYCKNIVGENIYVFNDSFDPFCSNVKDMKKRRGHVSMTLYKALGIALSMGYDKIYICGFDNDWFKYISVDKKNEIYIDDNHFYSKENQDVVKIKVDWAKDTSEAIFNSAIAMESLEKFRKEPIINLDPTGLINCFSKDQELDVYL